MKIPFTGLVLAVALVAPPLAYAGHPPRIVPPPMPADLELSPDEFTPFFVGHAIGTQGYMCVRKSGVYTWQAFGPQATLYDTEGKQVATHFLSPEPYSLLPSATWQHSRDSSAVWAFMIKQSSDANYVAPDAIPWLLLEASVVGEGPTGGDWLMATERIQRVNTVEGKAPTTGCSAPVHVGKRALVPYEADYFFYKAAKRGRPAQQN
jgi:hypothetical protein